MKPQRKPTNRIAKVNSVIQKVVGEAMLPFLDEGPGIVTVSKVEASRDLKWAKVWISIVGGDDDKIMGLLHKHIYEIQGELIRTLPMKIIPRIQFFLDTSPRYVQHIDELIKQIHEEDDSN
jgi:ribosome-binding factor A